ncbi:unnamed protein product [Moneuplotes crassus]|uniref:Uncharacterized protein n=1 Tax=Euplotes crassus TaxID=5936 RepID=A0AAD1UH16_EUPCR|nr:unnamed protein product [Moneuplotes crassus]
MGRQLREENAYSNIELHPASSGFQRSRSSGPCKPSLVIETQQKIEKTKKRLNRSLSRRRKELVVPTNFMIKYDPPKIGVKYESKGKPGKFKVKSITLAHLKKPGVDSSRVVDDLFKCYSKYFHKKHTEKDDVKILIDKIIAYHSKLRTQRESKAKLSELSRNMEENSPARIEKSDFNSNKYIKSKRNMSCFKTEGNQLDSIFDKKRARKLTDSFTDSKEEDVKADSVNPTRAKMTSKEIALIKGKMYRELSFFNHKTHRQSSQIPSTVDNSSTSTESENVSNFKTFRKEEDLSSKLKNFGNESIQKANLYKSFSCEKVKSRKVQLKKEQIIFKPDFPSPVDSNRL